MAGRYTRNTAARDSTRIAPCHLFCFADGPTSPHWCLLPTSSYLGHLCVLQSTVGEEAAMGDVGVVQAGGMNVFARPAHALSQWSQSSPPANNHNISLCLIFTVLSTGVRNNSVEVPCRYPSCHA